MHHSADKSVAISGTACPVGNDSLRYGAFVSEFTLPDQIQRPFFNTRQIIQAVIGEIRNILDGPGYKPIQTFIKRWDMGQPAFK